MVGEVRAEVGQGGLDIQPAEPCEALANGAAGAQGRQALFRGPAVHRQVLGGERLQHGTPRIGKGPLADQEVGHRPVSGEGPRTKRGDQLLLVHHPVLKCE